MTNRAFFPAVFATGVALAGAAHAGEDCANPFACANRTLLEEIVITGTRIETPLFYNPNSMSLVTSEELKKFTGNSLAEALRDVPGLSIIDSGQAGMKRLRIRGEQSYRVAVLVDGQQITDHRRDGVPLTLDPALVERVEVVRGAGSVLYGPRALGGVVNFITRKGGDEPLQATLSSGYQSATDGTQYLATVYGSHRDFAYRAAVTASQDRERETPAGTIPNTRAETDSQSLYLARQLGDHRLALRWDDHDAYSEVFVEDRVRFAFPFSEFEIFIPQRDRRKLGVFYDWSDISANLDKFHVDVYRQVSDRQFDTHWEQAAFGQENSTFSNSQLVTSGGLAQFDWQFADAHTLVTGIQYVLDEEDQDRREVLTMSLPSPRTTTNLVVDDARLETFSVFAQNDWRIRENLSLVAGIRQYWVESELRHTSRAGLAPPDGDDSENILTFAGLWDVTPNTVARLSYSQGYMYPTLLQLSIGGVDRTFVNPNPDLLPETSDTWELGLRYNSPSLQADFTVFYSEAENYIDQVTCTLASCIGGTARVPSAIYVNIGEAETLGFEGFAEYSISENLATYGSLTLMERRNIFTTFSTRKTGIPPLSGTAGVKYSAPLMAGITYWLDGYLRGEQGADEIENNGNRLDNAGWVTWNLEAGVVAGPDERVRISLGLYNLGDKLYSYATENLFAPGRSVEAKVTLNF